MVWEAFTSVPADLASTLFNLWGGMVRKFLGAKCWPYPSLLSLGFAYSETMIEASLGDVGQLPPPPLQEVGVRASDWQGTSLLCCRASSALCWQVCCPSSHKTRHMPEHPALECLLSGVRSHLGQSFAKTPPPADVREPAHPVAPSQRCFTVLGQGGGGPPGRYYFSAPKTPNFF